ncbi:asparagine synthase (glutamine-hydrolyzing) [Sulfurovum sp. zt1-1]|uniref:asparagine synthase (glutamine-hydrolyzing) n=1 Tax=Sulfurovum zhangzhouensis TaxID=3019067 RepID=A0ABT7QZC3_9BACT|nr:asparagine synthase (glutamine-hydrolyzing) [Sulfurovum zhangzhouensis]MDM5272187.1 asparagine synthase (glutamine-hydrolyzing) [Sulfurovum zhangzhouensis]
MCAIFGIVGKYDTTQAQGAFETLTHRGVDESNAIGNEQYFLGVHRLAITAIHTPHIQPIQKENLLFAMNGEVYNYRTLAHELGIEAKSDTQVAFAAYQQWGDRFVEKLRGMFAIAIIENGTVKLFRDPFGKKPLYYTIHDGQIIFASELKAIHSLKPLEFTREVIPGYLSYQAAVTPSTFDKNVFQVGAGYQVSITQTHDVSTHQYFSVLDTPVTLNTKEEAIDQIHQKLIDSVILRLPAEVKYGALLSGGLDSSLIAALAASNAPLHTFSIGYEGYEQHDERPYAARVAEHIGSTHHAYSFTKENFLETMEKILVILDEPFSDPAMVPLFYLMEQIHKEGIKVVLTGDGSDELFLGYRTYKEYLDIEQLSNLKHKNWLKTYLKSHFSMHKEWEWYKRILEDKTLFRSSAELFTDLQQNKLLKMNIKDNHSLDKITAYIQEFEQCERKAPVDWYSFLDLKIQLGEVFLRKLDRISMAQSIEARTPFLDKELVQTVFASAPELRIEQISKGWIKEIAKTYLPEAIIHRKKKGFNYPYLEWLQSSNELEIILTVQKKFKLFNDNQLKWLLLEGEQGRFQHQIFSLYILCKWMDRKLG